MAKPAPQRTLVYRISFIEFRTSSANELVLRLNISAGFLDDGGLFSVISEITHVVDNSAGKSVFFGTPNPALSRMADLRAALAEYLIDNDIIHGEVVE